MGEIWKLKNSMRCLFVLASSISDLQLKVESQMLASNWESCMNVSVISSLILDLTDVRVSVFPMTSPQPSPTIFGQVILAMARLPYVQQI